MPSRITAGVSMIARLQISDYKSLTSQALKTQSYLDVLSKKKSLLEGDQV
jgi:hypothetical protein